MLALDVEAAKKIALAIIIASVVLALFAAKFVKAALAKAIVILLLGSLIVTTVSQRSNIAKCGKDLQAEYVKGNTTKTTCKFLGFDFSVSTSGGNTIDPSPSPVTTSRPRAATGGSTRP